MTLSINEQRHSAGDTRRSSVAHPAIQPEAIFIGSPSRYQSTTWQSRLSAMGGVLLMALIMLAATFVTWTTYHAAQKPAALAVFDVAPPAAPPEPMTEIPPGPKQMQKEQQRMETDLPRLDMIEVQVPIENPLSVSVAMPLPDPGPHVLETTSLESKPLPPAPVQSTGAPTWEGLVLGALDKVKRYPRMAQVRGRQGVPYIRFVMDRAGRIISIRLERSSGHADLDREALSLPKRAQPLPKPPENRPGEALELVVPVEFFIR